MERTTDADMARQVVEMILTRRTALLGLGSLLAAPAVVRAASLMPLRGVAVPFIYGDGIRCDAAGLQAAFNGHPFADISGSVVNGGSKVAIKNGNFRITRGLRIKPSTRMPVVIRDSRIVTDTYFPVGESMVTFERSNDAIVFPAQTEPLEFYDCHFIGNGKAWSAIEYL